MMSTHKSKVPGEVRKHTQTAPPTKDTQEAAIAAKKTTRLPNIPEEVSEHSQTALLIPGSPSTLGAALQIPGKGTPGLQISESAASPAVRNPLGNKQEISES